jgi:competence protein ComEC
MKYMSRSIDIIIEGGFFFSIRKEDAVMKRPLLWFSILFVLGMAIASTGEGKSIIFVGIILGLWIIGWLFMKVERSHVLTILLLVIFYFIGAGRYEFAELRNQSAWEGGEEKETTTLLKGTIVSNPSLDGNRLLFDLRVTEVASDGIMQRWSDEKVRVYLTYEKYEETLEAKAWSRGHRVQLSGVLKQPMNATNFDAFDYRNFLLKQRIHWTFHVQGADQASIIGHHQASIAQLASYVDRFRELLASQLDLLYEQPAAGFMKGLIIGIREDLDPTAYEEFSRVGLTHILAISGLHVGLFVGALLWLLGRLPITRESKFSWTMWAVPFYVIMTGAAPSVLRAGIMAMIALYLARRNLLKDGLNILAFTAILMLTWNPFYMHQISFQLSFLVTAGLIMFVPMLSAILPITNRVLNATFAVTIVAQIVSFPLTIFYFNHFSFMSLTANLIMVPMYSFIVLPFGTFTLIFSFIAADLSAWLARIVQWTVEQSFAWVAFFDSSEGSQTIWATPPFEWIAIYYVCIWSILLLWTNRLPQWFRFRTGFLLISVLLLGGVVVFAYQNGWGERGSAKIAFLDVGQGDAILIRTPHGRHILVDGGGTNRFIKPGEEWKLRRDPYEVGKDLIVPLLKKRGIHQLDALFISHADQDHIGGLQAVIEEIPVARVFFNGTVKSSPVASKWFATAIAQKIPLIPAKRGDTIAIDPDTTIQIIHSGAIRNGIRLHEKQNEVSLVSLLKIYTRTLLLTGDIGSIEEATIMSNHHVQTDLDLIKIAHHGSKNSTSSQWLANWQPRLAIISAGRNNIYRHPHPDTLERLRSHEVLSYRTDLHGEIQFRISPEKFQVRTKIAAP